MFSILLENFEREQLPKKELMLEAMIGRSLLFEEEGGFFVPEETRKVAIWIHNEKNDSNFFSSSVAKYFAALIREKNDSEISQQCEYFLTEVKLGSLTKTAVSNVTGLICEICAVSNADFQKTEKLIRFFSEAVNLQKKQFKDLPNTTVATTLKKLALGYLANQQPQKAIETFLESIKIYEAVFPNIPNVDTADILFQIGETYHKNATVQNIPKAAEFYSLSMEIRKKLPETPDLTMIEHSNVLADVLIPMSQYSLAKDLVLEGLYIYKKKFGNTPNSTVAGSIVLLGTIEAKKKNFDEAINFFEEAISVATNVGGDESQRIIALAHQHIGITYLQKHDIQNAHDNIVKSLHFFKALYKNQPRKQIFDNLYYLSIGICRQEENAIDYAIQAYEMGKLLKISDNTLLEILERISISFQSHKGEQIANVVQDLVPLWKKVHGPQPDVKLVAYLTIAAEISWKKNPDFSLDLFLQALDMLQTLNQNQPSLEAAVLLRTIATSFYYKKDNYNAQNFFFKHVEMMEKINGGKPDNALSNSLMKIGEIFQQQGAHDNTLVFFQKSLKMKEDLNMDFDSIYWLNQEIGTILLEHKQDYQNSIIHLEKACDILEKNLASQFEKNKSLALLFVRMVIVFFQTNQIDKMFEYSSKLMSDSLNKYLNNNEIFLVYYHVGQAYSRKGDYDKAIEFLEKSVAENKEDSLQKATVFREIAEIFKWKKDLSKAELYLQKADDLDQKN